MIAVIIAGGSGSRLWPLSTPDYPKHLLSLTNNKSLLQNTVERAKRLANDIYVISEASHIEHVYAQMTELPRDHIIVEPGRRGTASCVIAALEVIKRTHDENEPIVFMHADHHIRDVAGFVETLQLAGKASQEAGRIVLLGVEPTHPATGFGYIQRGEHANGYQIYDVTSFKEKPDWQTAQEYLNSGHYLWNMGYFIATLSVFEQNLENHSPNLWQNYQKLIAANTDEERTTTYLEFEGEPIDTALIENVPDLLVAPGAFDWMDLGSFPDVHQVNAQDSNGNTLQGKIEVESVVDSFIRNDTNVPVAVIGLDNVAVVVTAHGLLVTSKSYAQRVGDVSKRLNS